MTRRSLAGIRIGFVEGVAKADELADFCGRPPNDSLGHTALQVPHKAT